MLDLVVIKKGQYLSQVEPFLSSGIPSDTIIYKEVTGCGITTYAYKYFKMPLIGCLPNRPVIEDKVSKHNKECKPSEIILGVHKDVSVDDIIDYLNNDEVIYKKILTTPEGFIDKVVPAFGDNLERMFSEYFFLIDECERIITDVSYRGKIAAPVDLFFRFTHKAMVSATVLPFSDPRFNSFKKLYIEPDYDYRQPLKLIETNNVVESLQKRLDELNSDHALIFLNSTDTILATAKRLGIVEQSHAYCSEDSASKLFTNKFKNADDQLDVSTLGKYNFLTSRFFSAFDIVVDYKPDVIMITDVYAAPHSVLDPFTEVIQIAGRCRNGINSLTHIANFDSTLQSKSKEEALYYLQGCFDTYQTFLDIERKSDHPGVKDMLRKAIEDSMAHSFYTNGKLNSFMIDNYIHEERVKGYYQQVDNLKAAYALKSKHFVVSYDSELYPLSDEDRKRMDSGKPVKELRREIAHQLYQIIPRQDYFPMVSLKLINYIRGLEKKLTSAFDVIGLQGLETTGYVYSKMDKAVRDFKRASGFKQMAPAVCNSFHPNTFYPEAELLAKLAEIRQSLGIEGRTTASMIKQFFDARRTTRQGTTGWLLGEKQEPNSPNH